MIYREHEPKKSRTLLLGAENVEVGDGRTCASPELASFEALHIVFRPPHSTIGLAYDATKQPGQKLDVDLHQGGRQPPPEQGVAGKWL